MAAHTGGTVYSWELCGIADRVTIDCQCATCACVREELTPEELATLPRDTDATHQEGSTMITIDTIGSIRTVYAHVPDRRSKAKPGTTRVISARKNGAVKTWKTRPTQFRAPFKYGLRECFYITDANAHQFFATEEEAAASPVQQYIG